MIKGQKYSDINIINQISIPLGDIIITSNPERYCLLGIGTCLCVYCYDLNKNIYLMAHTILPSGTVEDIENEKEMSGRYTDHAIECMYDYLISNGSKKENIKIKIVGGGYIYNNTMRIGEKNIEEAERAIKTLGINLIAKDIGGKSGKSVLKFHYNGEITIRKKGIIYNI